MPNWTKNILFTDIDFSRYFYDNDDSRLDFNKIIPIPNFVSQEQQRRQEWKNQNWGSRDVGNGEGYGEDKSYYWFQTAWGSPLKVIKRLAEIEKKDLTLVFVEEGNGLVMRHSFLFKDNLMTETEICIGEYWNNDDYDLQDRGLVDILNFIEDKDCN